MRDDYLKQASKVIPDPNILINVVSRRVKQLRSNDVESLLGPDVLEKLDKEDIALREIVEGKISYELFTAEDTPEAAPALTVPEAEDE